MNLFGRAFNCFAIFLSVTIDTDPFDIISGDKGMADNENLKSTAASFHNFLITVGVIGCLITIIIAGIMLTKSDPKKRQEAKENLLFKFIMIIIIFSFAWIAGLVLKITSGLA